MLSRTCVMMAMVVMASWTACARQAAPDGEAKTEVQGLLFLHDQPAAGAVMKFVPVNESGSPASEMSGGAQVEPDGHFSASYFGQEVGLEPGNYAVLVYWMQSPSGGGMPVDRLRGKFSNIQTPLTMITVPRDQPVELGKLQL
ncbi:MAG: hypothetical protein KDA87_18840 [Planctomycetales bacterium]|nr:hypothetical protein [Planctomycetales bacterium]